MQLRPFSACLKYSKPFSTINKCFIDTRASDKLFQDAAREEAKGEAVRPKSAHLTFLENRDENWTGEENVQDAVLRMLVDKYKPLRSGTIRTAEEKLKGTPPRIGHAGLSSAPIQPSRTGSWANEPLLPSSESHRPWHTEYKVPSHVVSSIKLANIPPPVAPRKHANPQDDRARRQEKEVLRRTEQAGRLGRARESTLDYKLGLKGSGSSTPPGGRPNPVSLKGWASLIEDRIERARSAGIFNNVKGRGKPLVRTVEESNPFIAREEFLMNRIVQKNGAVPPWVELQAELDTAVTTFRDLLRQSWTRRAIRNLTTDHPPQILARFTIDDVKSYRDKTWEQREMTYHDTAVEEVNAVVRKYNGIAPYAVRRPYYIRSVEVERLYEECAEDILRAVQERTASTGNIILSKSGGGTQTTSGVDEGFMSIKELLLDWFGRIAGRWRTR
ncbi:hypothetical protein Moror_12804 [Moniliophthora roreri MCA 2997]|uniref:DnaJ homologue subfamily C member 28 conserved domain-containing protein n=1 Tax=Moniliophthora roreri (strain MCA 2997) TaxID=1381753 RepID=V2YQV8_MONRO|nr:hypothetical protein Moror_12804 [Moniliophthora roreri MCA 2997]